MTTPLGTISGVASGIQWRDLVDQIMAAEQARRVGPITRRQTAATKAVTAWQQFQGLAASLRDAASVVRDADAFVATTASVPAASALVLGATGSASAVPGRYDVEVLQLARTDKVGGAFVADSSAAMGVTGTILVNGRAVNLLATDSLVAVRDKINGANSGTTASGVAATIQGGTAGARLVLSASDTGASGIELADGTVGALAALGLDDGTTTGNVLATGEMQSFRVSSGTAAMATLLGVSLPTPSTLKVGGTVISVDLSVDSLTTIAARVNSALGTTTAARVVSESANGRTQTRLVTTVPVEGDATVDAAASARTMSLLGFTKSGRGGVAQVVASASAFTSGGGAATGGSLLTALGTAGGSFSLGVGDVVTLQGTRGDGSAVTRTLTIGAGSTMQDVVNSLNNATTGYAAGVRPASAAIDGTGRITLTDSVAGDSQLALSVTVARAGGGTTTLGAFGTANGTVGRSVVLATGQDAAVRVDGRVTAARTNSVSGAVGGVTLDVRSTNVGAPVALTVARDAAGIIDKVKAVTTAYNALRAWVTTNSATGGPLANDPTVRAMSSSLTNGILASVVGLPSGVPNTASLLGLQHDKAGVLALDTAKFSAALNNQPTAVRQLFALTGDATDSELSFITASLVTKPSASPYAVAITQASTRASVTGAIWATYATLGAPDTMTISDASSGQVASVSLANGDTIDAVLGRLNAEFSTRGMSLSASKTVDGRLQLDATDYGSAAGFTVAYTPGVGGDGTATLGIAAGAALGLDVTGTINGVAATGRGQVLTGASGDPTEGLTVRYAGTTARAVGTVRLSLGVNGLIARLAATMAGGVASVTDARISDLQRRQTELGTQANDMQARLAAKRARLTSQFVAMESSVARSQAIASALNSQISGFTSSGR